MNPTERLAALLRAWLAVPPPLLPSPAGLHAAHHALTDPPRWVLLGRAGLGKTTLANQLCPGTRAPVGLGGCTAAQRTCTGPDGLQLVDQPGLDGPHAHHAAPLDGADGLLLVLDALAPFGTAEALALSHAPPDAALVVVIARGDLLEASEHAEVYARIHARLGARAAAVLGPCDARQAGPALLRALQHALPPAALPRTRYAALDQALSAALNALPPWQPDADAEALEQAWRDALNALQRALSAELDRGSLRGAADIYEAISVSGPAIHAKLRAQLSPGAQRLAPSLPGPPRPASPSAWASLGATLAGRAGAERALTAQLATWLGAAVLALTAHRAQPDPLASVRGPLAAWRDEVRAARPLDKATTPP